MCSCSMCLAPKPVIRPKSVALDSRDYDIQYQADYADDRSKYQKQLVGVSVIGVLVRTRHNQRDEGQSRPPTGENTVVPSGFSR